MQRITPTADDAATFTAKSKEIMRNIEAIRDAMDVFYAAEAHILRYVPGASLTREGPMRHLHYDKPLWWETDAFHTSHTEPAEVVESVRTCRPGPHLIGVVTADPEGIVADYAALGYKTVPNEPMETVMARPLKPYTLGEERHPVQRVQTEEQRQFFNAVVDEDDPHGQINAAELGDSALRYYYVEMDSRCVCHARAILPLPDAVVIEPLGTDPPYRRRRLATAVMNRLLTDAVATGAERSVILATAMGVALYSTLKYEIVAYIQKFVPQDWRREDYS
jgi:hypothetical protein